PGHGRANEKSSICRSEGRSTGSKSLIDMPTASPSMLVSSSAFAESSAPSDGAFLGACLAGPAQDVVGSMNRGTVNQGVQEAGEVRRNRISSMGPEQSAKPSPAAGMHRP